jgi:hypothetical protein
MKELIAFCDGGLGNRMGVLVGGLLFAQKLNRTLKISWPKNTWCGCGFADIFKADINVYEDNINEVFSQNLDHTFLIHENQTGHSISKQFSPNEQSLEILKKSDDNRVIYYHNSIPGFFSEQEIINALDFYKINDPVVQEVNSFCISKSIDNSVLGIHLRKTDYGNLVDENSLELQIKENVNNKFFICSDDQLTEHKFAEYSNVIVRLKNNYVEKLNTEIGWNGNIVDMEGRSFGFNINRPKDSVIDGFVDMLILSRTNIIVESISSFLKFAKLYSKLFLK